MTSALIVTAVAIILSTGLWGRESFAGDEVDREDVPGEGIIGGEVPETGPAGENADTWHYDDGVSLFFGFFGAMIGRFNCRCLASFFPWCFGCMYI